VAGESDIAEALRASAARALGGAPVIRKPVHLSGGASQDSWRFELERDGQVEPMVLRRSPGGRDRSAMATVGLGTEASLLRAAERAGVPVPAVRWELAPEDGLGLGYVMAAVAGETLPKRILRDDAYAEARAILAWQCGETLARLHAVADGELPELPELGARNQLGMLRQVYKSFGEHRPVMELGFRWLAENAPNSVDATLVHGDFRNGNLMVGEDGLRAVLDWELAHRGDPMEDLGWLCVPSWRFGALDKPAGGFGEREDLFAGYEAVSGRTVDRERVRYWEVFGILKWGVICLIQAFTHLRGEQRSVELATIGRRVSETEIDLLAALHPRDSLPAHAAAIDRSGPRPSTVDLVEAVGGFLKDGVAPSLSGRTGFHAKVASNALAMVERELRLGLAARAAEQRRLKNLLGRDDDRDALNAELCTAITEAEITDDDAALIEHLWATTADRLAIDQPTYATYRRLAGEATE